MQIERKLIAAVAIVLVMATVTWGQQELVDEQGWFHDESHGVKLQKPDGAKAARGTTPDMLVRFLGDQGRTYTISVTIKRMAEPVELETFQAATVRQVTQAQPYSQVLEQTEHAFKLSGADAFCVYFAIPDRRRDPSELFKNPDREPEPWMLGQVGVQLSPLRYLVIQLDVEWQASASAKEVFEAVYRSLRLSDYEKMDESRSQLIKRGEQCIDRMDPSALRNACVDQQWFRIIENGDDIGYMSLRQHASKAMGRDGVQVDMTVRVFQSNRIADTMSNFFLSDDRRIEIWSVRTLNRPKDAPPDLQDRRLVRRWTETGTRSDDQVNVIRDGDDGLKKFDWTIPPRGYLSQVHLHLLGQTLVDADPVEMAFYAYNPGAASISFRTEKLRRLPDGAYQVTSRPSPDLPPHTTRYDRHGRFMVQEHDLTDGERVIRATTRRELELRWKDVEK